MSEHTSAMPPPLPTEKIKPKRKWRRLRVVSATILGVVLLLKVISIFNPVDLEVNRTGVDQVDDGRAVELVNIGAKPVTLTNITVNDRADCLASTIGQAFDRIGRLQSGVKPDPANNQFKGTTLAVGDKITYVNSCRIRRVLLQPDTLQGPVWWTFSKKSFGCARCRLTRRIQESK
jgi:hypothetical protein